MTDPPTHVLAHAGDRVTLCGLKPRRNRWHVPLIVAEYVALHQANYDLTICPQCAAVMDAA